MKTQSTYEPSEALAEILPVVDAVIASLDRRLPVHVSREDLASAGKLALVQAFNRFEGPTNEARAYCFTRVRGAVFDELRRLDPLSRRTRAQVSIVQKAAAQLEESLGRTPSETEVSEFTGLHREKIRQLERIASAAAVRSLDETSSEGEPLHQVADPEAYCPAEKAEDEDLATTINSVLSRIPVNQAYVLRRYHFEDATLDEIAGELRVSRERVRQLRVAAEKRLRSDVIVMALWETYAAA
ncbi:MAG: sigma-70 family RNA polymerase sigma factor [Opitutaceae bacterium]